MKRGIKATKQKRLRSGYTTGACATAAAKAAALVLITQKKIAYVDIILPGGQQVRFRIFNLIFDKMHAASSVIKDAGDDPDVTNKAEIRAEVAWLEESDVQPGEPGYICLEGGEGVGVVTKPGLPVGIGRSAINPVPERMIRESVKEVMESGSLGSRPLRVIISVPKGRELARRTLNFRLGIVGGISILGTTGIVNPVSLDAYRETIKTAINVAFASGIKQIVLIPGRSSEKIAERIISLPKEAYIMMGDHADYSLRYAYEKGIRDIIIVGQLGKLSKIAAGNFATHVKDASVNRQKMVEWGMEAGLGREDIEAIRMGNTTRYISEHLRERGIKRFFHIVAREVISSIRGYLNRETKVRCILISGDGVILADRE